MGLHFSLLKDATEIDDNPLFELLCWIREHDNDGTWFSHGYQLMGSSVSILDLGELKENLDNFSDHILYDDWCRENPPPNISDWLEKQTEKGVTLVWVSW